MRSLDDALPAAKAARASVSAVKNRHGEAEGGAAFRKTFADLGHARDTSAKTQAPGADAKAQPAEPNDVATTLPALHTKQTSRVDAEQPSTLAASGPTSTEAEGKSEQAPHAAVARSPSAPIGTNSPVSSEVLPENTDALALLSVVTTTETQDTTSESPAALSAKTQTAAVDEDVESSSVPIANREKAQVTPALTTPATRPSATAALSATLALKAIKPEPEAVRAEIVAAAATAPADDETKVAVGKSLDTVETPSKAVWKTKENLAAPLVDRDLERSPVARLRAAMPERTAEAASVEKATTPEVAAAAPSEIPQEPASAAVLANAGNRIPATTESIAGSEPAMPAVVQALAAGKTLATPPSDAVETAAEKVSVQAAASPLSQPTRQVTTEIPPEPAEEPMAASVPAEEADIRSLMAILGPFVAQPMVNESAKTEKVEAESDGGVGMQGLKVTGDRGNMPMIPMAAADSSALPTSTDGTDQVFRFARADGKASPISLRADADRPASKSSNDQANTKAETVTVLDARRYLGIAPTLGNPLPMTANAQAVAAAITGNGDPTQGLQANTGLAGSQGATGKVVNTLKIQMHPIDLGLVTATLRLRDDELQIDLRVHTGDAYRQLTNDQDAMIKALRAQGFQVDQVNVIFTPSDSAGGNDGSGQPQSNQQQPSQNGRDSQGGLAAGNGGEGRNGGDGRDGAAGQRSANDGRTRQDTLRETPAAPQPGLSDELYF